MQSAVGLSRLTMSDVEDTEAPGGGATGGNTDPGGDTQNLSEYLQTLTEQQKLELLQLLQGAKPKTVKPEVKVDVDGRDTRQRRGDANVLGNNNLVQNDDAVVDQPGVVLEENKIPKLPFFSGDQKSPTIFRVWEFEVQNIRDSFSERIVKRAIHKSVSGTAAQVLMRLGKAATLQGILTKFDLVFGTVVTNEQILSEFYTAEQKSSETVAAWACRLEDLLCHPQLETTSPAQKNSMLKAKFFQGLVLDHVKNAIRHRVESGTYDEILVLARQAEEERGAKSKVVSKPQTVDSDPVSKKLDEIQKDLKSLTTKVNDLEGKIDKRKDQTKIKSAPQTGTGNPPKQPSSESQTSPSGILRCNYCKKIGHLKRNCRKLLNASSSAARSDP